MNNNLIKYHSFVLSMLVGAVVCTSAHAHQGSSTAEPRVVCAEKKLGAACEWKNGHDALYIGSCRKISTSLLCVRNKPIVYPEGTADKEAHEAEQNKIHKKDARKDS